MGMRGFYCPSCKEFRTRLDVRKLPWRIYRGTSYQCKHCTSFGVVRTENIMKAVMEELDIKIKSE